MKTSAFLFLKKKQISIPSSSRVRYERIVDLFSQGESLMRFPTRSFVTLWNDEPFSKMTKPELKPLGEAQKKAEAKWPPLIL
ncbi:hypothetical protein VIOR3934_09940 [Vibrio orientalis CIP 102891 = ATCC 33934]|uniref:Uncharacterized protein n=1 Tax=Vibrio orientalis CIP 102891 = ATCC 33934 TaxID=675816 RepID=F9SQ23_VIBOR|nr:hypothetical protein VIOR3934_09940 [Vibrio orientalis CIP 102891 = ATCC 33934]